MSNCCMKPVWAIVIALLMVQAAFAQDAKEMVQPLSKKASKGYMYSLVKGDEGNFIITYKIPGDKKNDPALYEEFSFDKDLKLLGDKDIQVTKEQHEDKQVTGYSAWVGGCSSFDIISMKLRINKTVVLKTWDQKKQRYVYAKTISSETIKAKNDDGKNYTGYASYVSDDEAKSGVLCLVKNSSKDKNANDQFYILMFDDKMELNVKPADVSPDHSLVYCQQMDNEDVIMVFAPNKEGADANKYVYLRYDIEGNMKSKTEFNSPASALLITAAFEKGDNVYFCGSSTTTKDPFQYAFQEYAPILNPCFTLGDNYQDSKWEKAAADKMDNFHLLKISGNKLVFATTTPVSEFKSKFKVSPSDKGADSYKGKKFDIEQFYVTATEDYIITGQLTGRVSMGTENSFKSYEDLVCLQFDKDGILKAQYGVEKLNTDKKSEIFEMTQNFFPSADGKSLYWMVLEVKGVKGYASFSDAYNGAATFYPLYYPRFAKIDLGNSSVSAFKVLGSGDYFLRKDYQGLYNSVDKNITFIGHDEDFKKLWLSTVSLD